MRRTIMLPFLAIALVGITACGSDSTGPDGEEDVKTGKLTGTYQAVSISGVPLPFKYVEPKSDMCDDVADGEAYGEETTTLTSFTLTFGSDNTYTAKIKGSTSCKYAGGRVETDTTDEEIVGDHKTEGKEISFYLAGFPQFGPVFVAQFEGADLILGYAFEGLEALKIRFVKK